MNPTGIIKAEVYKAGTLAATLTRRAGMTEFRYREDYLAAGLRPVATSLPLTHEPLMLSGGAQLPFPAQTLAELKKSLAYRHRQLRG
jgi:serine/threonine-protein kinase HipA